MKPMITVFILISLFFIQLTLAQIPQTMSYQGMLTDNQGQTVNDGSYQMTFKIYNQETDGTLLWEETQNVDVASGVFNVVLGANYSLTMDFNEKYWLGITIASGDELEPRIEMTASPYSLNSQQILGTNIIPADGNVGIGITNPISKLEVDGSWSLGITGAIPAGADGRIYAPNGIYSEAGGTDWAHYFSAFGTGDIARFATGNLGEPLETKVVIRNNGNVGIGLSDPQEKLEVNGMIHSTLDGFRFPDGTVQTTAASGSGGEGDITAVNAGNGLTGGATSGDATLDVNAGTGITVSADAVGLNTTYTDNRYVNEGQSNSISVAMISSNLISSLDGVSNDGGNVDLVAGSNVTITSSDAANTITISASGGGTADNLGNHIATQDINLNGNYLSGDGDSEGIFVNTAGRVGIGISSPATHLHVHGSPVESRGQLSISAPPGEDTFLSFYEGSNFKAYLWYDDSDDDLRLQNFNETNGGDLSLNPYGGHVGIGTINPGNRKLNVVGGSETAIEATSTGGNAIYATSSAYSAINAYANCGGGDAAGYFTASEYGTYAVYARSQDYDALYASSSSGYAIDAHSGGEITIRAESSYGESTTHIGVHGSASGGESTYGIYGVGSGGSEVNYAVYADGNLAYTGALINASDVKLKEGIQSLDNALDKINSLQARSYRYKTNEEYSQMNFSEGQHYGFVAQELEQVLPELISENVHLSQANAKDSDKTAINYKGVNYIEIIPILVKAIQEQQEMIESLKYELDVLKSN